MAHDHTLPGDMKIYDTLVQTSYLERIMDNLDAFNAASRNGLVLTSEIIPGDYKKKAHYRVGGALAQRNITSNANADASQINSSEIVSPKLSWKYGPYSTTYEAFVRRGIDPQEFFRVVGQDMADAAIKYFIQAALGALDGALGQNTDMIVDDHSWAVDGKKTLTAGLATLGDRMNNLVCWVMHSGQYINIIEQAITDKIYEEAGTVVYGGAPGTLGRPVVVTDVCSSTKIYGLQANAVQIIESAMPITKIWDLNEQENIAIGYRAEGSFNVEARGYTYDTAAGGANPTVAALALAANWDTAVSDDKDTAGFIIDLSGGS